MSHGTFYNFQKYSKYFCQKIFYTPFTPTGRENTFFWKHKISQKSKNILSIFGILRTVSSGLEPLNPPKNTYMTITFDRHQIYAFFLHPWMRLINTLRLVPISMSQSSWFKSYDNTQKNVTEKVTSENVTSANVRISHRTCFI